MYTCRALIYRELSLVLILLLRSIKLLLSKMDAGVANQPIERGVGGGGDNFQGEDVYWCKFKR